MDKISISQKEDNTLHNAETFVLDKLFNKDGSEDYFVNLRELMTSVDNTSMSPLLDQAVEELIAESLIHSDDGENYQITPDGINELKIRKSEPIPL
ncbi:hypothetical protein [Candidatus Nitrosocosmicus hydrocola]|uniref:hypothetical protein n=1 Tax=Candidatus Nitrosocosmicus hydrocola TaxID=1826872 RepID=UPI0011E5FB43|nr:hypothetical protein [Candidatus Nitrosocosmicus hydrocola]